jgi:hypothetical protein
MYKFCCLFSNCVGVGLSLLQHGRKSRGGGGGISEGKIYISVLHSEFPPKFGVGHANVYCTLQYT